MWLYFSSAGRVFRTLCGDLSTYTEPFIPLPLISKLASVCMGIQADMAEMKLLAKGGKPRHRNLYLHLLPVECSGS